jgi:hypothetical protein
VGFEPTVPCGTPVFKTGAFGHSATSPGASIGELATDPVILSWVRASSADCWEGRESSRGSRIGQELPSRTEWLLSNSLSCEFE